MSNAWFTDVIVVGAGLAGLSCAWHLREHNVAILRPSSATPASELASGGIAAAIGEEDAPVQHELDTVRAGAGLVDAEVAHVLASEGMERMIDLFELPIAFDRDGQGKLHLGREALHSQNRIIHAAGDETGRHITAAVRRQVETRQDLEFVDGQALELVVDKGRICGVVFIDPRGEVGLLVAPAVVLATGGVGSLFERTTNPGAALGQGLAMAARAGAQLVDLEFLQFHPTALRCERRPLPLLTEALRGAGATLVDDQGRAVMGDHPRGDLAGRDEVARAIWQRLNNGESVFLDATAVDDLPRHFPAAFAACRRAGLDPCGQPIPVTPAAHYHMGGVATDLDGATSVEGLWAAGEVASTGAHGANRLASNSLLEALVFGTRAARSIAAMRRPLHPLALERLADVRNDWAAGLERASDPRRWLPALRAAMWRQVGLERSEEGLSRALAEFDDLIGSLRRHDPGRLAAEAARLIAASARHRCESRGAHYRLDHPRLDPAQSTRLFVDPLRSANKDHLVLGAIR